MKKYFSKYLAVEGEIKRGDMVWDGRTNPQPPDWPYYKVEELDDIPASHLPDKKVKLFLCSREVMIGDKAYHSKFPERGEHEVKNGQYDDMAEWEGENIDESDLFKVFGEISPDALSYVKEGQEFEWPMECTLPMDEGKGRYCQIKGQCGHFH